MKKAKAKRLTRSIQVKLDEAVFQELSKISEENGVGVSTVVRFGIPAGIELVKAKLAEMREPQPA